MEMVLLSDIHLGRYKYGKMNSVGYDFRTQDILDNIQQAFNYASDNKIKNILILGDFYHTKKPPHVFRRLLASKLEWALEKKIDLYLLLGNHDQGKSYGNDLVELIELSKQIKNLIVIEKPTILEKDNSLLAFMPHVNAFDANIDSNGFYDYVINCIRDLSNTAYKSKMKYKYFFGHYATSKSIAGKSFDMGTDEKSNRVLPIEIFDNKIWTKVFLGDIHKQQEMNLFCRHVGSIAKVDFGEEGEHKGFYYVKDDLDTFIKVKDREFKTIHVNLLDDPRKQMESFCDSIQDIDLSESIVRLKIAIKEKDKNSINFEGLEQYLKEQCWNYIGKDIQEIREAKQDIKIDHNEQLNFITMFRNYVDQIDVDLKEDIIKKGEEILKEEINSN